MRKLTIMFLILVSGLLMSCSLSETARDRQDKPTQNQEATDDKQEEKQMMINIEIEGQSLDLILEDNQAAQEFLQLLPLTVDMADVNGNEKVVSLNQDFSGQKKVAGSIQSGELKIWSANQLVLFYDSFPSSYSYLDLGHLAEDQSLPDLSEKDSVTVRFSIKD